LADETKTPIPADGMEQATPEVSAEPILPDAEVTTPDIPAEPPMPGGETPAPDIPGEESPTQETADIETEAPLMRARNRQIRRRSIWTASSPPPPATMLLTSTA
jgi:hypothetical protein